MKKFILSILAIFLLSLVLSFERFIYLVHYYINNDTSEPSVQAIVVLTGDRFRIKKAINLLKQNKAPKLLISGVAKKVTLQDLLTSEEMKNIANLINIDRALTTQQNALESIKWAEKNNIKSFILITSDYHMPRTMTYFNKINNDIKIFPSPVFSSREPFIIKVILKEYAKYIISKFNVLFFNKKTGG